MGATKIAWADMAWPILVGCQRVSTGCENCWAESFSASMAEKVNEGWRGARDYLEVIGRRRKWTGKVLARGKAFNEPLQWKNPKRVFVAPMSDLFHERVTFEFIAAVWGMMWMLEEHTFKILTKRPMAMVEFETWLARQCVTPEDVYRVCKAAADKYGFDLPSHDGQQWPPKNVWAGVSVENQDYLESRVPKLLEFSLCGLHFVSVEPLLGPLVWDNVIRMERMNNRLGWVIVGGESQDGARPCRVEWILETIEAAERAGVPAFLYGFGSVPVGRTPDETRLLNNINTSQTPFEEWPEEFRRREMPRPADPGFQPGLF